MSSLRLRGASLAQPERRNHDVGRHLFSNLHVRHGNVLRRTPMRPPGHAAPRHHLRLAETEPRRRTGLPSVEHTHMRGRTVRVSDESAGSGVDWSRALSAVRWQLLARERPCDNHNNRYSIVNKTCTIDTEIPTCACDVYLDNIARERQRARQSKDNFAFRSFLGVALHKSLCCRQTDNRWGMWQCPMIPGAPSVSAAAVAEPARG